MFVERAETVVADDARRILSRQGFLAPVPLLTPDQCRLVVSAVRHGALAEPMTWEKGLAASDRLVHDLAGRPALVRLLRVLLGDDVVLWGALVVTRRPGDVHPWHCDIESSSPHGGFISVWIGLEHTCSASALKLLPGSHRFGRTLQEVQAEQGLRRGEADDERVAAWARAFDSDGEIVQPDVRDGEAILFDGRLWHGSSNELSSRTRWALLLQYARGDASIYMADLEHLEWPTRLRVDRRPPVVPICGDLHVDANHLVQPPAPDGYGRELGVVTRPLGVPLTSEPRTGWRAEPLFAGSTPNLDLLSCHRSVLDAGRSPHPPHVHLEEELLVMLDGEAEILLADSPDDAEPRSRRLGTGDFVYHPAFQHHTLRNPGGEPISYLVLKWRSKPLEVEGVPGSTPIRMGDRPPRSGTGRPFEARLLFERPTNFLAKLHCHLTELGSGGGYEAHRDSHDVVIVLLEGSIVTGGTRLTAPAVALYAGGELHGMRRASTATVRYLVFELHGDPAGETGSDPVADEGEGWELTALERERHDLVAEAERLRAESERLRTDNERLRAETACLERWLRSVLDSRSWRWAAPLRSVAALVRRHPPERGDPGNRAS